MKDLNDYIQELLIFNKDLESNIEKIIIKNQGVLLTRLKLRLFNYGTDGSGSVITPSYSDITIVRKKKNSQRSSHVTLRDTGSFYASMFVSYYKNKVEIFSSDYKTDLLTTKYGDDILGLTSEEQEWFMNTIIDPGIQDILNNLSGEIEIK